MDFYPNERIAIVIDGPNLLATARSLGLEIDFKRLVALFQSKARLVRSLYYTTTFEQHDFASIRPLLDWLQYNGYTLVTKPARAFVDSEGRQRFKGNMNVELAVDTLCLSEDVDHIVLFSGEGDFRSLVAELQVRGKRVTVVSTLATQPPMVADDLRRQADQFIDLNDLEPLLGRVSTRRR